MVELGLRNQAAQPEVLLLLGGTHRRAALSLGTSAVLSKAGKCPVWDLEAGSVAQDLPPTSGVCQTVLAASRFSPTTLHPRACAFYSPQWTGSLELQGAGLL